MARKTRIKSVFDLSRVPLTPAKTTEGYETRKEFYAREKREENERREAAQQKAAAEAERLKIEAEAPIRKWESEYSANLSRLRKIQRMNLSDVPSDELASRCPATHHGCTTAEEYSEKMLSAVRKGIPFKLEEVDKQKIMDVAKLHLNLIDLTNSETWAVLFAYLLELGVLSHGEFVEPIPQQEQAPEPVETVEPENISLDDISTENPEWRRIVSSQWGSEVRDFYQLWAKSMHENWGLDVLTEEMARRVGSYMVKWNLNPIRYETYDQIRRAFSKLGYFGEGDFRTGREMLSDFVEDNDMSNRDVRRAVALKHLELMEHAPPLPRHK